MNEFGMVGLISCLAVVFTLCGIGIGNRITVWRIRRNFNLSEDDLDVMAYKYHQYEMLIRFDAGEIHPEHCLDAEQKSKMRDLETDLAIGSRLLLEEIEQTRRIL